MYTSTLFLTLVAAAAAACTGGKGKGTTPPGSKAQCALQFDGRIPKAFTAADFDGETSPFNTANVFGKGLKFSDLIKTPGGSSLPFGSTIPPKPPSALESFETFISAWGSVAGIMVRRGHPSAGTTGRNNTTRR
ncbi:hypothetical protein CTA1_12498 [Colletotrichum tanaceti]|uniref:Uncharacterized protein n=1 Tax=Colletotrichum tanaceti TaxID=1306861 RepID=A0A4U6X044_9PEZI|nr:hypothetical protein CTA1_12498 [Colletotrichum tanaceti]